MSSYYNSMLQPASGLKIIIIRIIDFWLQCGHGAETARSQLMAAPNLQMKQFLIFLFFLSIAGFGAQAQSKVLANIMGKVADSLNQQPLPDATISLVNAEDSSGAGFAIADKQGMFELKKYCRR